ncbi:MAG TPA: glycosyltransferase family 1 protein [Chloroflexi bacterium]|nr:glycosyltransferase family 1 protein [Chloroflexota bacterium]
MKILVALTYYRPHVSGLTIYVERLARALVERGHHVTVLTSRFDPNLPSNEVLDGVSVVRVPVVMRVSKGVIMPTIGFVASKLVYSHDVLSIHLPQLDASGIALRARILGKPSILTYHSDLLLPRTIFNRLVNLLVDGSNHVAARLSDAICAYTSDFAISSPLLSRYLSKVHYILPPVTVPDVDSESVKEWAKLHGVMGDYPIIGVASRLAADKGIEFLLNALPKLLEVFPNLKILHAGPIDQVIGESAYYERLKPIFEQYSQCYKFVGTLDGDDMARFYRSCDLLVLPSINSTETFGLVQIEAALCGVSTIASDLPGVRVPTQMTGMGFTVEPGDSDKLGEGILRLLDENDRYHMRKDEIYAQFAPSLVAEQYESLFRKLLISKQKQIKNI